MESYTGYLYGDGPCYYNKRDGLGDDKSRKWSRPMCATTPPRDPRNQGDRKSKMTDWNRFQKLIRGNEDWSQPEERVWLSCESCGCAYKKMTPKRPKPKTVVMVPDSSDAQLVGISDHPRMQERFDEWKESIEVSSFANKKKRSPNSSTKRRDPPEHRCRHTRYSSLDSIYSQYEELVQPCKAKFISCSHCPEPYRPWIRNNEEGHTFQKIVLQIPPIKTFPELRPKWEEADDLFEKYTMLRGSSLDRATEISIQSPADLKARLRHILEKDNIF